MAQGSPCVTVDHATSECEKKGGNLHTWLCTLKALFHILTGEISSQMQMHSYFHRQLWSISKFTAATSCSRLQSLHPESCLSEIKRVSLHRKECPPPPNPHPHTEVSELKGTAVLPHLRHIQHCHHNKLYLLGLCYLAGTNSADVIAGFPVFSVPSNAVFLWTVPSAARTWCAYAVVASR